MRFFAVLLLIATLLSRVRHGAAQQPASVDPALHLGSIPAAQPEKYRNMVDMSEWKNPALTVKEDGIELLDPTTHRSRTMKPGDVPAALDELPSPAWPYGRVVMASENGPRSVPNGGARIRKNRVLLVKALNGTQVLINWVPSA